MFTSQAPTASHSPSQFQPPAGQDTRSYSPLNFAVETSQHSMPSCDLPQYDWENKWLKGDEYAFMLTKLEQYCQAYHLNKYPRKTHPEEIYRLPQNGLIYFVEGNCVGSEFGFPRVPFRKQYRWKKMNFTTDLPKKRPQVTYIVASSVKCSKSMNKKENTKETDIYRMHAVILYKNNKQDIKQEDSSKQYILCHIRKIDIAESEKLPHQPIESHNSNNNTTQLAPIANKISTLLPVGKRKRKQELDESGDEDDQSAEFEQYPKKISGNKNSKKSSSSSSASVSHAASTNYKLVKQLPHSFGNLSNINQENTKQENESNTHGYQGNDFVVKNDSLQDKAIKKIPLEQMRTSFGGPSKIIPKSINSAFQNTLGYEPNTSSTSSHSPRSCQQKIEIANKQIPNSLNHNPFTFNNFVSNFSNPCTQSMFTAQAPAMINMSNNQFIQQTNNQTPFGLDLLLLQLQQQQQQQQQLQMSQQYLQGQQNMDQMNMLLNVMKMQPTNFNDVLSSLLQKSIPGQEIDFFSLFNLGYQAIPSQVAQFYNLSTNN